MLKDGVQTRAVGDLDEILAETDNVTQYPKKQDADSHVYAVMVTDAIPQSWFQLMPSVDTRLRVRYAETDQMGVVYHANYLIWMEVGRVEYWRAAGLRYRDMEREDGVLLVVAEVNCRYLSPAVYDEEVIVRTSVAEATPRMIRFEYELLTVDDGRKLATGYTKHVFCGADRKPAKLPQKYHQTLGIKKNP
jgi:acyl-CoA thioester hydrolase